MSTINAGTEAREHVCVQLSARIISRGYSSNDWNSSGARDHRLTVPRSKIRPMRSANHTRLMVSLMVLEFWNFKWRLRATKISEPQDVSNERADASVLWMRPKPVVGTRRKPATWWQWITVTACNDNHTKTAGYHYTDNNSDTDKFAAAKAQVEKKEAHHHQADVFSREKKRKEDGRRSFVFSLAGFFARCSDGFALRHRNQRLSLSYNSIPWIRLAASRIHFHSRAAYIYLHTRCTARSARSQFEETFAAVVWWRCNPP